MSFKWGFPRIEIYDRSNYASAWEVKDTFRKERVLIKSRISFLVFYAVEVDRCYLWIC